MKKLFIAEKPSVASEFVKIIATNAKRNNGYYEDENNIFTWCVGHLVAMSYPEVYDEKLKKWDLEDLPFIPMNYRYEVINNVKQQFEIVTKLMKRADVDVIYVCTDSGREGEYIYRLIEEINGVPNIKRLRVWIDSQTQEEILRGIKEAKDLSFYDSVSDSAYLRAKEDYLMGINFSRLLTLKFSNNLSKYSNSKWVPIAIGRVMSCVLGMVVKREKEIRNFVKSDYFKVNATFKKDNILINGDWHFTEKSDHSQAWVYKDIGFLKKEYAQNCIDTLSRQAKVDKVSVKKESKKPPFLYNLAELQNECSKTFKIPPTKTLDYAQQLYEKKLITYPRTDAKVLSTAIAKQVVKNLNGLKNFPKYGCFVKDILDKGLYKTIIKSKYVDDKKITDHYAIIPTGEGLNNFSNLDELGKKIYGKILIRFLSVMFPPAIYENLKVIFKVGNEEFISNEKVLKQKGYLEIAGVPKNDKLKELPKLKKGDEFLLQKVLIKEQETSPPQRYNSGTIILAMENAGNLIEDEELRLTIKGSGIGTSATRAEIINKLCKNSYIVINNKTQVIKPTLIGECISHVIESTIPALLNPVLSASWEKGLTLVSKGEITKDEYMDKLKNFVETKVNLVKKLNSPYNITKEFDKIKDIYR